MTKILHVVGGLKAGGIESLLYNLFSTIDREEITFDFVKKIDEIGEFERPIRELGGHIYKSPKFNGFNYFSCKKWWGNFFDRHQDYKIIHVHDASSSMVYLGEAKKRDIKIVAHSHNVGNAGFKGVVKKLTKAPLRKSADYYIGCSDEAGEYLFGRDIVNSDRYTTLSNGIDVAKFAYDEDARKEIRNYLGIKDDELVLGHIGRFTKVKNHDFLIKLFAEVHSFKENTKLLLIGDGPLLADVKTKVEKFGLQNSVIFTGTKINPEKFYSAMDIFVFPSIKEGLGIAAIEAQASGLTVIKSQGVTKDIDITGNVVELNLEEPIINWTREIIQNKPFERNLCTKKIKNSRFDINETANILLAIYQRI